MVVMDDGWFGKRNDDNSSLGDWQVNEKKLGGSLADLITRVHEQGVKFGIWIEPEMVTKTVICTGRIRLGGSDPEKAGALEKPATA